MSEDAADFVDDILPKAKPEHALPRRDFKAWHRVRKQFVREKQWNSQIRRFADRHLGSVLQAQENQWSADSAEVPETARIDRPLRCLVIPGDDLLDVRSLWRRLRDKGWFIEFLGFNETMSVAARQARIHLAQSQVVSLSRMSLRSTVIPDRFQNIANDQSLARRYLREYGPYDVVNLDLCDSLLPHSDETATREYYRALLALIRYQHKARNTPWLLFITTQIDAATASQAGFNELCRPTRKNCNTHQNFADKLATLLPREAFTSDTHELDLSLFSADQLTQVFGLLLGKWLAGVVEHARPRWSVNLLPSYRYGIRAESSVSMCSLGFLFKSHLAAPSDPTHLTGLIAQPFSEPSELDMAMQMIGATERIQDVVSLLESDAGLQAEMLESAADLLSDAGYDRTEYLQWVARGEPSLDR